MIKHSQSITVAAGGWHRIVHTAILLLAAFLLFTATLAQAAEIVAAAPKNDWTLNAKDVDIAAFVEQISGITGRNFVVDPQVKGKVSVVSTTPMNADAVYEVFLTVLRVNGLAAVASGEVTRIVPQANVKLGSLGKASAQQLVTRVLPVRNTSIDDAVKILKPLISTGGYLDGSAFSSSIIVSDYGDNVAQVARTLAELDQDISGELEVIPLKEGLVGDVVPLIEAMSPLPLGEKGKPRARLRVIADERSNSIIVRGDKRDRAQIRELVRTFDRKAPEGNEIQLIRLRYADAKTVAALIRGLIGGEAAGAAPPLTGNRAPASTTTASTPTGTNKEVLSLFGETLTAGGSGREADARAPETVSSFIQANVAQNALIVKASPSVMSEIRALVKQLDTRSPQVLIEAAIVEVNAEDLEQLGVQLAAGGIAENVTAGASQFSGSGLGIGNLLAQLGSARAGATTSEGLAVALGSRDNFNVIIQALANTTSANLLSTPSITTLDNEEAKIVVGQSVPFRTGSFSTLNSGIGSPFTTIERQDVGITLRVIPQIHEGNLVRLTIAQEVSSIADATNTSGAADLITNKRTIETKVVAEDGETIVLGGLMADDTRESVSKVPLLGDIPLIGTLFRNTRQNSSKRNLLVFLRPTVLGDRAQMNALTQERYGRIYDLQTKSATETDNAADKKMSAPPADAVFTAPPKTLPWLVH